jgi:hypothetical protein
MEVYKNLHESLQTHVHRMHMNHNVLEELKTIKQPSLCENCTFHGFPCLNCAYYVFHGKLGPGFCFGKRTMFCNEDDPDDKPINFTMLLHILQYGNYELDIVSHSGERRMLPQEETYYEMHS